MIKSEYLINVSTDFLICAYAIELGRNGLNFPRPVPASYTYPIPEANMIFTEGAFTEVLALPINALNVPIPIVGGRILMQYQKPPWA